MAFSGVHIPRPCRVGQQALSPTEDGWHCARCSTEVVDFTRLTEAEVVAYLAARKGQRVCARIAVPLVPRHPKRLAGARRWLLGALVMLGAGQLFARRPLPPHASSLGQPQPAQVVVRGTVLDDSLGGPVPGAYVFIEGTKYGAIADERGEFSFCLALGSKLLQSRALVLVVSDDPFTFLRETVTVPLPAGQQPAPLQVRLRSVPERGYVMGKMRYVPPPVAPPGSRRQ